MAKLNYKQIVSLLASDTPEPFQGNSMWGAWGTARVQPEQPWERAFIVYSYRTAIAWYFPESGKWVLNPNKYSVTTSKQQGYLRQALRAWELPSHGAPLPQPTRS